MTVNLYWKSDAKFKSLVETPFRTENELETYIFSNQEILGGDITIIHRQIRASNKQDIPDMLGVDRDGRICLLELKNVETDEDVLPQALRYGIWAETNPDSIKAIWLESKRKPDGMVIDWDNLEIRIILIAPWFKATVRNMAGKIGYPVDLIEIRRYSYESNEYILVDNLDVAAQKRVKTTKVLGDWSWEYYETAYGSQPTAQFKKAVEMIDAFAQRQGWNLAVNLTQTYTGFKLGNRVVFAVSWGGSTSNSWVLTLKLPEKSSTAFKAKHWEFHRYVAIYKEAQFRPVNPESPAIDEIEPLLIAAYENVTGRK